MPRPASSQATRRADVGITRWLHQIPRNLPAGAAPSPARRSPHLPPSCSLSPLRRPPAAGAGADVGRAHTTASERAECGRRSRQVDRRRPVRHRRGPEMTGSGEQPCRRRAASIDGWAGSKAPRTAPAAARPRPPGGTWPRDPAHWAGRPGCSRRSGRHRRRRAGSDAA